MSWSKEDRKIFEESEVFKNMEKRILENYYKLQEIQRFANMSESSQDISKMDSAARSAAESANNLAAEVRGVGEALNNLAEDGGVVEPGESSKVEGEGFSVTVNRNNLEEEPLTEEQEYFNNTIDELKSMAYEAATSGNIKLAYKIERAIDEIIEVMDENK
tara:strand:- start:316 stop:798 length:483 start_codon:yes stop_codon:yes gene_type:complete